MAARTEKIVTIIGVIIATLTFMDAAWLNRQAARLNARSATQQAEAAAVGVLNEYFKLAIDNPALADRPDSLPVSDSYEWFASHAYFTAETIYTLTDKPEWESTVVDIITLHHAFVRDGRFNCVAFNARFVEFVRQQVEGFRCATT